MPKIPKAKLREQIRDRLDEEARVSVPISLMLAIDEALGDATTLYDHLRDEPEGEIAAENFEAGIVQIAVERLRQVESGHSAEQDDERNDGALARMAVCYATPVPIYMSDTDIQGPSPSFTFFDPWPPNGEADHRHDGDANDTDWPPDPASFPTQKKIRLLVRAGALIVAEIDRLHRVLEKERQEEGVDEIPF